MAVIIPDMDIPSNCMACKLSYSSPFGDVMCAANGYRANKQKCPLKSADECKGEDCVSRAEVLKLMKDNWHTHNGDWAMQESIDAIREMPSVTPQEPKTGYWIDTNDDGFVYHRIYKCSHCGATVCEYPENMHESKYNYCSTCGIKMVEPQESEDKE